MNENYYQDTLEKIKKLIEAGDSEKAASIITEELSMPYLPADFAAELQALIVKQPELRKVSPLSDPQTLLALLNGTEDQQLAAVYQLSKLNLRNYQELLQDYFLAPSSFYIAGLLIALLIEQEVTTEFSYQSVDGEVRFRSNELTLPSESVGFKWALKYLNDELKDDEPAKLTWAEADLVWWATSILPRNMEKAEAIKIADIIKENINN